MGPEEEATRDRHLAYYRAEAERVNAANRDTAGDIDVRLYRQSDDVRAALTRCISMPDSAWEALSFACDLHRPVLIRWSFSETQTLWETLLEHARGLPPDRILLNSYSHASWYLGRMLELDRARYWAEQGVAIADQIDDPLAKGRVRNSLGSLCYQLEQYEEAESNYREAIRLVEPCDSFQADIALYGNLGNLLSDMGRVEEARQTHRYARLRAENADDPLGRSIVARHEGELEVREMNFEKGREILDLSFAIASQISMEHYMMSCLTHLYGYLPFLEVEDPEGAAVARKRLEEGVQLAQKIGAAGDEYEGRIRLIEVCASQGDFTGAASNITHLPRISVLPRVKAELYRACAWLAFALDSPGHAAGLAMIVRTERANSRSCVTPFEKEMVNRLDAAIGGSEVKRGEAESLIAELVQRAKTS